MRLEQFHIYTALCLLLLGALPGTSALDVTADVSTFIQWQLVDSPVLVKNSITITSSGTLQVDAGVHVIFEQAGSTLTVDGELRVEGQVSGRVHFRANGGTWDGITFSTLASPAIFDGNDEYVSGSRLAYVDIYDVRSGPYSVAVRGRAPFFENVAFSRTDSGTFIGVGTSALNSRLHIRDCVFSQPNSARNAHGVHIWDKTLAYGATISGSTFSGLHKGIFLQDAVPDTPSADTDIEFCTFDSNDYGVESDSNGYTTATMANSTFSNSIVQAIRIYGYGHTYVRSCTFTGDTTAVYGHSNTYVYDSTFRGVSVAIDHACGYQHRVTVNNLFEDCVADGKPLIYTCRYTNNFAFQFEGNTVRRCERVDDGGGLVHVERGWYDDVVVNWNVFEFNEAAAYILELAEYVDTTADKFVIINNEFFHNNASVAVVSIGSKVQFFSNALDNPHSQYDIVSSIPLTTNPEVIENLAAPLNIPNNCFGRGAATVDAVFARVSSFAQDSTKAIIDVFPPRDGPTVEGERACGATSSLTAPSFDIDANTWRGGTIGVADVTLSDATILVKGSVHVPSGTRLSLENVVLEFESDTIGLVVEGVLDLLDVTMRHVNPTSTWNGVLMTAASTASLTYPLGNTSEDTFDADLMHLIERDRSASSFVNTDVFHAPLRIDSVVSYFENVNVYVADSASHDAFIFGSSSSPYGGTIHYAVMRNVSAHGAVRGINGQSGRSVTVGDTVTVVDSSSRALHCGGGCRMRRLVIDGADIGVKCSGDSRLYDAYFQRISSLALLERGCGVRNLVVSGAADEQVRSGNKPLFQAWWGGEMAIFDIQDVVIRDYVLDSPARFIQLEMSPDNGAAEFAGFSVINVTCVANCYEPLLFVMTPNNAITVDLRDFSMTDCRLEHCTASNQECALAYFDQYSRAVTYTDFDFSSNYVEGGNGATLHLRRALSLTFQNNSIANNDVRYELRVFDGPGQASDVVDVRYNYWGSTNMSIVANLIYSFDDDASKYRVDYLPYLASSNPTDVYVYVPPPFVNYEAGTVGGVMSADETIAARSELRVPSSIVVPSGVRLLIEEGVRLEFAANAGILVLGELVSNGTESLPVTFQSTRCNPASVCGAGQYSLAQSSDEWSSEEAVELEADVVHTMANFSFDATVFDNLLVSSVKLHISLISNTSTSINVYLASPEGVVMQVVSENSHFLFDLTWHAEAGDGQRGGTRQSSELLAFQNERVDGTWQVAFEFSASVALLIEEISLSFCAYTLTTTSAPVSCRDNARWDGVTFGVGSEMGVADAVDGSYVSGSILTHTHLLRARGDYDNMLGCLHVDAGASAPYLSNVHVFSCLGPCARLRYDVAASRVQLDAIDVRWCHRTGLYFDVLPRVPLVLRRSRVDAVPNGDGVFIEGVLHDLDVLHFRSSFVYDSYAVTVHIYDNDVEVTVLDMFLYFCRLGFYDYLQGWFRHTLHLHDSAAHSSQLLHTTAWYSYDEQRAFVSNCSVTGTLLSGQPAVNVHAFSLQLNSTRFKDVVCANEPLLQAYSSPSTGTMITDNVFERVVSVSTALIKVSETNDDSIVSVVRNRFESCETDFAFIEVGSANLASPLRGHVNLTYNVFVNSLLNEGGYALRIDVPLREGYEAVDASHSYYLSSDEEAIWPVVLAQHLDAPRHSVRLFPWLASPDSFGSAVSASTPRLGALDTQQCAFVVGATVYDELNVTALAPHCTEISLNSVLSVESGALLVLGAGVTVLMAPTAAIVVHGRLVADSYESAGVGAVTFTAAPFVDGVTNAQLHFRGAQASTLRGAHLNAVGVHVHDDATPPLMFDVLVDGAFDTCLTVDGGIDNNDVNWQLENVTLINCKRDALHVDISQCERWHIAARNVNLSDPNSHCAYFDLGMADHLVDIDGLQALQCGSTGVFVNNGAMLDEQQPSLSALMLRDFVIDGAWVGIEHYRGHLILADGVIRNGGFGVYTVPGSVFAMSVMEMSISDMSNHAFYMAGWSSRMLAYVEGVYIHDCNGQVPFYVDVGGGDVDVSLKRLRIIENHCEGCDSVVHLRNSIGVVDLSQSLIANNTAQTIVRVSTEQNAAISITDNEFSGNVPNDNFILDHSVGKPVILFLERTIEGVYGAGNRFYFESAELAFGTTQDAPEIGTNNFTQCFFDGAFDSPSVRERYFDGSYVFEGMSQPACAACALVYVEPFLVDDTWSCANVNDCSARGFCLRTDTCVCEHGYTGDACDQYACVGGCNELNGGGNCTAPHECTCAAGWVPPSCKTAVCESSCSGNGVCIAPEQCLCFVGFDAETDCATCVEGGDFYGPLCKPCPCAEHGQCAYSGACICDEGYSGTQCTECATGFAKLMDGTCAKVPTLLGAFPRDLSLPLSTNDTFVVLSGFNFLDLTTASTLVCDFGGGVFVDAVIIVDDEHVLCEFSVDDVNSVVQGAVDVHLIADSEPIIGSVAFEFTSACTFSTCVSGQGVCSRGRCSCLRGYRGSDCSDVILLPSVSAPPINAVARPGETYVSEAVTIDTGTPPFTFQLVAPRSLLDQGASLDVQSGTVVWSPVGLPGNYSVVVRISNDAGSTEVKWRITVLPAFNCDIEQLSPSEAPSGTKFYVAGTCRYVEDNTVAALQPITVFVVPGSSAHQTADVSRARLVVDTLTDLNGEFVTLVPSSFTDVGTLGIGAAYVTFVAATVTPTATAYVAKLRADPGAVLVDGVPGDTVTAALRLVNDGYTALPLTVNSIAGRRLSDGSKVALTTAFSANTIEGGGGVEYLYVNITSEIELLRTYTITVGAGVVALPIKCTINALFESLAPLLAFERPHSYVTIARGKSRRLSLRLYNVGTAPALHGSVLVVPAAMPVDAPVIATVVSNGVLSKTLPENATFVSWWDVDVSISVKPNVPFGVTQVKFVCRTVNGGDEAVHATRLVSVTVASDVLVDVRVRVEDEFTYHDPSAPLVLGASVRLESQLDGNVEHLAETGTGGLANALLPAVKEGVYIMTVSATDHSGVQSTVLIDSTSVFADDNYVQLEVFLARTAVSYTFSVRPTTIKDEYTFAVSAQFETHVPMPVVTIDPALVDVDYLRLSGADALVFNMTNHGLVQADSTRFLLPDTLGVDITLELVGEQPGDLPALSTTLVEYRVTHGIVDGGRKRSAGGTVCITAVVEYDLECKGTNTYTETIDFYQRADSCELYFHKTPPTGPEIVIYVPEYTVYRSPPPPPPPPGDCYDCYWIIEYEPSKSKLECITCGPLAFLSCLPIVGCPIGLVGAALNRDLKGIVLGLIACFGPGVLGTPLCIYGLLDCQLNGRKRASTPLSEAQAYFELQASRIDNYRRIVEAVRGPMTPFLVQDELSAEPPAFANEWLKATDELSDGGEIVTEAEQSTIIMGFLPDDATVGNATEAFARYNRMVTRWQSGDLSAADDGDVSFVEFDRLYTQYLLDIEAVEQEGFGSLSEAYNEAMRILGEEFDREQEGTCATVTVSIEQELTLTRSAFIASLEMDNSGSDAVEQISVEFFVTQEGLTNVNTVNRFAVVYKSSTGFVGANVGEKTDGAFALGSLDVESHALMEWTIVPGTEAAPIEEVTYRFGGTITYTVNGFQSTSKLLADTIVVAPDPRLSIHYFWPWRVTGDDPFTPGVEPSELFTVAVMAVNSGAGTAHAMSLSTEQPTLEENEKGLAVEFSLIDALLDGSLVPEATLNVNIGDLKPSSASVVQWRLLSSLQGTFAAMNVSVTHSAAYAGGKVNTSLIESVQVHELTRVVEMSGDVLPAFLVNENADPKHLPDKVYRSAMQGNKENVWATEEVIILSSADADGVFSVRMAVNATLAPDNAPIYVRAADPVKGATAYGALLGVSREDGDGALTPLCEKCAWRTRYVQRNENEPDELFAHVHWFDESGGGALDDVYVARFGQLAPPSNVTVSLLDYATAQVEWLHAADEGDVTFSVWLRPFGAQGAKWTVVSSGDSKRSATLQSLVPGAQYAVHVFAGTKDAAFFEEVGDGSVLLVPVCTPSCVGRVCGSDGCGGVCGSCPRSAPQCAEDQSACECAPICDVDWQCGHDGCGGECGDGCSGADEAFCVDHLCVANCTVPLEEANATECGIDSCGVLHQCEAPLVCSEEGVCECEPQCVGRPCGDDGCGGQCGSCAVGQQCSLGGQCECLPSCDRYECGGGDGMSLLADGCGGSCVLGACNATGAVDVVCNAGECFEVRLLKSIDDSSVTTATSASSTTIGSSSTSVSGDGMTSAAQVGDEDGSSLVGTVVAGVLVPLCLIGALVAVGFYIMYRRMKDRDRELREAQAQSVSSPRGARSPRRREHPGQRGGDDIDSKFVISNSELKRQKKLGEGAFGIVYKGTWGADRSVVAIKTIGGKALEREGAREDFLREAMAHQGLAPHPHVVTLYGVVTEPPAIVQEFCALGSLDAHLYGSRVSEGLITDDDIPDIAVGVASGLTYLHRQKIVHRDVAARNVLLTSTKAAKIGDFGMALQLTDTVGEDALLPIRWTAPECLNGTSFSYKSDVWSFGCTLIEMYDRELPWSAVRTTGEVAQQVMEGATPPPPSKCPDEVVALFTACCKHDENERVQMHVCVAELRRAYGKEAVSEDDDEEGGGGGAQYEGLVSDADGYIELKVMPVAVPKSDGYLPARKPASMEKRKKKKRTEATEDDDGYTNADGYSNAKRPASEASGQQSDGATSSVAYGTTSLTADSGGTGAYSAPKGLEGEYDAPPASEGTGYVRPPGKKVEEEEEGEEER